MFDSFAGGSIGPYRIVRRLGGGDAADVLLATRSFPGDFERRVVIKRLRAFGDRPPDEQHVLATEAVAYARVAHPAIVQLFDFFADGKELALVLEYVDGPSLSTLVELLRGRRERLGDRPALYTGSRVFAALAAAHSARDPATGFVTPVIHRDVNPANVLMPWDGFVKLGDFDLAKVMGVTHETRSGLMKGTYGYMAPEQVLGEPVTPRTDVYAACLVLRELLLNRPAFDRELPELELLRAMDEARHIRIEALRGGLSARLTDALDRGLARNPAERTLTAQEMVEVLRAETDMEMAHGELIGILSRVRTTEERGSPRQHAVTPQGTATIDMDMTVLAPPPRFRADHPTPRTMTTPVGGVSPLRAREGSLPPLGSTMPPQRMPRVQLAGAIAIAAVIGGLGAVFVAAATRATAPPGALDESTASLNPPPYQDAPSPDRAVPPGQAAVGGAVRDAGKASGGAGSGAGSANDDLTGELRTPASEHKHRVFVDSHVAAQESGAVVRLACGPHVVRIGSHGATQLVHVPCGGSVSVEGGAHPGAPPSPPSPLRQLQPPKSATW